MTPSNNIQDDFVADDFEEEASSQDDFQEDKASNPKKEKVGWLKSAMYSVPELGAGLLNLGDRALFGGYLPNGPQEGALSKVNQVVSEFPESEDETGRRIRTGVPAVLSGAATGFATGGPVGAIIGGGSALIGSQAGQSVRETFGEEGKFKEFGWGEGLALGADFITSLGLSTVGNAMRQGAQQATRIPPPFQQPNSRLQTAVVKNAMQGERNALENVINDFSTQQIAGFENQMNQVSPLRYTEAPPAVGARAAEVKRAQDTMFRNGQLNVISPIQTTPEQAGVAIQNAANATFDINVREAERAAYGAASHASRDLSGQAPRTLQQARDLRSEVLRTPASPEQASMLGYLNDLIESLEVTTPARQIPASQILDVNGNPIVAATEIPASTAPQTRSANDLVQMVQKGNQAVNYDSTFREQSHRLVPILNTLREETGQVLSQDPIARQLYQNANNLHAQNSEVWSTRYMRNIRHTETPEQIISQTKKASNMRNFKQGVVDPTTQGLMERMVVDDATKSGSVGSNNKFVQDMGNTLSPRAQGAARGLIDVKDPLTTEGGRAAVRNSILSDTAEAVATGKKPTEVLKLMETPKGYNIVAQTLNYSPESRNLFRSFQRQFVEDIFDGARDKSGRIDFKKAGNIIKDQETRTVLRNIGGDPLVNRLENLEGYANNFQRNASLYKTPEVQSIFKKVLGASKNVGIMGYIMHTMHMPPEAMVATGLGMGLYEASKVGGQAVWKQFLSSPRAVALVERLSLATTAEQVARILPKLVSEIEDLQENQRTHKQTRKQPQK